MAAVLAVLFVWERFIFPTRRTSAWKDTEKSYQLPSKMSRR